MPPQILIADDHPVVRYGLRFMIKDAFPDAEIFLASEFETLLQTLQERKLTLAICDVNMPGCNHFHMTHAIKQIQPELKIIIYSGFSEKLYAQRFLKAGADVYLGKDTGDQYLIETIRRILNNDPVINTLNPETDEGRIHPITSLSDRELEVVHLMVKGWGSLEICNALGLNKTTVSTYKRRIYEKMNISTIAELVTVYGNYVDRVI
jgi:DNA-binding NarL/FixJ family response regulator